MSDNNIDIELLAGLGIDSSEAEILKAIKILQNRLKANHDARFKLNVDIDETVIKNTVDKLQNIIKNKELTIDTKDSIQAITKEVNAMADIVTVAKKASDKKLEFAKANKKVKGSADNTADAINRERNAMNSLDDIDTILNNINMSGRQGNAIFQQFGTTLRDAFYAFTAANLLEDAIYKVIDVGKEGVETVKELNDAATSLRMATGGSYESVKNLLNSYNEMGQELGALTTEVSDSADAWLRQNHTIEDTNVLIKDSMMLSKITNLDSADSTKYLTSAMQGYKVAVEDVVGIVDKLSAVDLVSATDAGGLAEAMSRTAEGAQIAGISMDRLLGMIATTGEVTQKEMTSIGESYKTIFARMRDIKDNKLSFVGDDGEIEDISNVEIVLEGLGIKLRESNQEFRNFQDVLDEVAASWDSYSSVQKSAIAKSFSGVRQAENFLVMMENWDKVVKYTDVAANSSGTSEEKFGYYLESLQSKTNSLIASLEKLASTTISDELYGSILDVSKGLVDATTETGLLKGTLAGLGTAGTIYAFQNITSYLNEATQGFANLGEAMNMTSNGSVGINDMQRLVDLTSGLSQSQTRLLLSTNNLTDAQKVAILMGQGMEQNLAEQTIQTWGVATAQRGATVATITFSNAMRGLFATLVANPLVAVTVAVSALTMAYQSYNQKLEETRQKNIEASETAIDHANNLKDLYNEYTRLSSIQNKSSSEEEEFKTVVEDVTKALGDKAKVLEGLTVGTNEYADALANATKEELKSASANATIGRKGAEEELQGDIWSEWKGSKVSIDSNSSGQSLSEEAQRAVDIVSGALKDFETVNKTWNNISWDITSDNPEKALEFYNALLKAREELVLASENDEALLDTEIYKDMNTAISAMEDSLDSYISKRYEEEKLIYMATNGIPQTTEEYKAMQDSLMATASASVDLQDSFKSLLMADFSSLANEIEGVSEAQSELEDFMPDGEKITSTIATSVKQIATQLEPQFAKLGEAYQNIFTADGFTLDNVDNSMLEELRQSFAEIEEEVGVAFDATQLNDFFDALTSGDSTAEQVQQSFNDLATSYFYSTDTLEQLNETTADSIAKQLEELGVINAKEVVYDTLAVKTEALALQEQLVAAQAEATARGAYLNVNAFLNQAGATETARAYLFALMVAEQEFSGQGLDVAGNIAELEKLANAYGQTAIAAKIARMEKIAEESHNPLNEYDYNEIISDINNAINNTQIDFSPLTTSAGKAGKDAGEAYKDALEDELSDMGDVLGYINDIIGDQIDLLKDQKDAAVSALEAEKEKAEEALEAEKELVQAKIDGLQDEIDKIEEAREQRKADIALQKAQFELERMQNQKTALIYKGGQMVYETDVTGIRDARESVDEAKENIKILQIEKEISGLEDIIDSLDKQIEESNNYYDNLIAQTELYWDSLIKGMEEYQDRWAQIGELEEQAKIQVALKELGIETDDILNMSGEAFEQFKQKYLGILVEMYSGNDAMIASLKDVAGSADFSLLDESMLKAKDSLSQLGDSATNASTPIKDTASAVGEIATNSEGVSDDINSINTALDTLSGENKLQGITDAFQTLLDKIDEVAKALGTTTEQMESGTGLIGAIQALNEAQISTELLSQFTELESAIDAVTTAISGGGDSKGQNLPQGGAPTKQGSITPSGSPDSGDGGGLTQALEEQVEKAKELLPKEIGLFSGDEESLLSAVTKVTTAIAGGGDSEGGEKKEQSSGEGEVDTSHLMGALEAQYNLAEEKIPTETTYFTELATAIEACVIQLKAMVETLENMPSATISFGGGVSGGAGVNGTAHYEGTANVRGNWGVREGGRSLVGELGQEIVVRNGRFFTVGDNGAEFVDLQRGDIVFNHVQTKSLLKNGYVTGRGKSYANGTFSAVRDDVVIKTPTNLPPYLRELREGDRMYDLIQKMNAHNELIQSQIIPPVNSIQKNMDAMVRNISNVNTNNTMQNVTNFSTGDIIVQGVQDVDGLAHAIKTRFPNAMIQAMSVTR